MFSEIEMMEIASNCTSEEEIRIELEDNFALAPLQVEHVIKEMKMKGIL